MREELQQRIREARERLGMRALTEEERAESGRREAMDEFKIFLVGKTDPWIRAELLVGGDYLWLETGPAARFQVDDHVFVLAKHEGECQLLEDTGTQRRELARVADDDQQFEARLLVALGDILASAIAVN
jgi:hypothetical protein